jgi:hypothetical protein
MGDFLKSKEHYGKASWAFERNQSFPSWVGFGKVGVARSKVLNKEKDLDLESLYAHSRNNKLTLQLHKRPWVNRSPTLRMAVNRMS